MSLWNLLTCLYLKGNFMFYLVSIICLVISLVNKAEYRLNFILKLHLYFEMSLPHSLKKLRWKQMSGYYRWKRVRRVTKRHVKLASNFRCSFLRKGDRFHFYRTSGSPIIICFSWKPFISPWKITQFQSRFIIGIYS